MSLNFFDMGLGTTASKRGHLLTLQAYGLALVFLSRKLSISSRAIYELNKFKIILTIINTKN